MIPGNQDAITLNAGALHRGNGVQVGVADHGGPEGTSVVQRCRCAPVAISRKRMGTTMTILDDPVGCEDAGGPQTWTYLSLVTKYRRETFA